jgi:hypothetical protein
MTSGLLVTRSEVSRKYTAGHIAALRIVIPERIAGSEQWR